VAVEEDSTRLITDAFLEASRGTLVERMGITISEASPERVVGAMPVAGNTQPYGLLHGGASCVLAETLGSLGSALHAGLDRVTMGIEISATHHRAATGGTVTGVATRLHGGRTITTYEIVVSDEAGRRVCTARLTCLLSDRVPGARQGAEAGAAVAAMLSTAPGNADAGGRAGGASAAAAAGSDGGARTAGADGEASTAHNAARCGAGRGTAAAAGGPASGCGSG
jgi:1,4-dihydroxy-2-naphthoyl-CoA hydrolase